MARRKKFAIADNQLTLDALWGEDTPSPEQPTTHNKDASHEPDEHADDLLQELQNIGVRSDSEPTRTLQPPGEPNERTDGPGAGRTGAQESRQRPTVAGESGPSQQPAETSRGNRCRGVDATVSWRDQLTVKGPQAKRLSANLDALETLTRFRQAENDPELTDADRDALSGWSSWGALPHVFDPTKSQWEHVREWLADHLSVDEVRAARRTTVNAHYTQDDYTQAIWGALAQTGLGPRHHVLEPGCGKGTFLSHAPQGVHLTGIELDPVTADIAQLLNPDATIRNESFADTDYEEASFDAAIGNVPFGNFTLHDPVHNQDKWSIHNHFIAKSVKYLRPGGVAALITSRHTLDATNPSFRKHLAEHADLIGAVRLPNGAHQSTAGTDVVTDVLLLRRRHEPRPSTEVPEWITASPHPDDKDLLTNQYFHHRPEHILGELTTTSGQYGPTLGVEPHKDADLASTLADTLTQIVSQDVKATQQTLHGEYTTPQLAPPRTAHHGRPEESIGFHRSCETGIEELTPEGTWEPVKIAKKHLAEARQILELRDAALAVITTESASTEDTKELTAQREHLQHTYQDYADRYGPASRHIVVKRTAADGSITETRKMPPARAALASDPHLAIVSTLDTIDPETGECRPADILRHRVIAPAQPKEHAETPEEALALCLDQHGQVKLDVVADLLDTTPDDAQKRLNHEHIFHDPHTQTWETRAAYLSGDVKTKHEQATAAAQADPNYAQNITALEKVIPDDLGAGEITVKLGAPWIPDKAVQTFLREICSDRNITVEHVGGSHWRVRPYRTTSAAARPWNTEKTNVLIIAEMMLTQKRLLAYTTIKDGDSEKRVVDPDETTQLQERAEKLNDAFTDWAWATPQRTELMRRAYNDKYNRLVLRTYDDRPRTYPGLVQTFRPHPHQHAAIQRMVHEPSVGLFHSVGAGKTAVMAIGTHELKRLGLVAKPLIVIPNHMLEQMTREYKQLFPAANVLAAGSEEVSSKHRARFLAQCATNDWDAVIMTQSAFSRIPLSKDALDVNKAARQDRYQELTERAARNETESLVKSVEKQLVREEERTKAGLSGAMNKWGNSLCFDQLGVDYLCIDELHMFKNNTVLSNGAFAADGSHRAIDLDMKLTWLRQIKGPQSRIMTGATATPLANTMAEMWTMQRFLRPDLLKDAGLADFDSWIGTFGKTTVNMEITVAGMDFRPVERIAAFTNFPELMRMWAVAGDIRTAEDLNLKVPQIAQREDGKRAPEIVSVPPSPATKAYVASLVDRAEIVKAGMVQPTEDMMLTITNDGRAAALDLNALTHRRYAPEVMDDPEDGYRVKLDAVSEKIVDVWQRTKDRPYPDSNKPGGLQIVFLDLATPTGKGKTLPEEERRWSAYDALTERLAASGIDPNRIRFMQSAKKTEEKAQLFRECREGDVDVLIGSTETMGVGTNVQRRAVALHHVDCPWRPCDIQQREGRIIRQGNQNAEVEIFRYVTEGTFDAYAWQTVERKAHTLGPVLAGKVMERDVENFDETALSFAEVKAIGSGDPNVLRKAQAEASLNKWERLHQAHERSVAQARTDLATTQAALDDNRQRHQKVTETVPGLKDITGDKFAMTIDGMWFTERDVTEQTLRAQVQQAASRTRYAGTHIEPKAVSVGGLDLDLHVDKREHPPTYRYRHAATDMFVEVSPEDFTEGSNRVTKRLSNLSRTMPAEQVKLEQNIERLEDRVNKLQEVSHKPFEHHTALVEARAEMKAVMTAINAKNAAERAAAQDMPTQKQTAAPPKVIQPSGTRQTTFRVPAATTTTPEQHTGLTPHHTRSVGPLDR